MAALGPILDLTFAWSKSDGELDSLGSNQLTALQFLAHVHNAMSARRRELLKPQISPIYARVLTRNQETSQQWLFGGDLEEATKKCDTERKIGEKVVATKRKGYSLQGKPQKKFRPNFPRQPFFAQQAQAMQLMMLRAYNLFQQQQIRFPSPNQFQPQGMGGFGGYQTFYPQSKRTRGVLARGEATTTTSRAGGECLP